MDSPTNTTIPMSIVHTPTTPTLSFPHSHSHIHYYGSPSLASVPFLGLGTLPSELLSEIFLHCVDGGMAELNTIFIPLLLSHVCARWRKAALATPRLWSRLFLTLTLDPPSSLPSRSTVAATPPTPDSSITTSPPMTTSEPSISQEDPEISPLSIQATRRSRARSGSVATNRSCTQQLSLVHEWLYRSGACPLTIYLFWENPPYLPSHPVLDALAQHSERWEAAFFYLPYAAFKALGKRVRKRLPSLKQLSLGTSDDDTQVGVLGGGHGAWGASGNGNGAALGGGGFVGKLDAFSNAPKLRSLECVNCSPLAFKFPWSQLKEIPMMSVSIDDCIDVLLQTSRLERGGFIFFDAGLPGSTVGFNGSFNGVGHNGNGNGNGNGGAIVTTSRPITVRHTHNTIRSFTIMTPPSNETVDLRPLFPQLSFPRLEELLICNLRSPFCAEFIGFLSRLRCLRTLHLRKTSLLDFQLVQGLRYLPTLTSLIVYSATGKGDDEDSDDSDGNSGRGAGFGFERGSGSETVTRHLLKALTWGGPANTVATADWDPTLTTTTSSSGSTTGPRQRQRQRSASVSSGVNGQQQQERLLPLLRKLELTIDDEVSEDFVTMVLSRVHLGGRQQHHSGTVTPHSDSGASSSRARSRASSSARSLSGVEADDSDGLGDCPARLEQIRVRPTEPLGDKIYMALTRIVSTYGVEVSVEDLVVAPDYSSQSEDVGYGQVEGPHDGEEDHDMDADLVMG
ncbi:hypothetical protein MD484_g6989, partial [Candolleomyces efflorescens]